MYEFLLNIVKLDYQSLNSLIVVKLKDYYELSMITHHDDNENSFIYVQGSQPYMLVAHLDTVHKQPVKEILITKSLLDVHTSIISSPQGIGGDDRNGIALIFALLDAGHRPSILFPSGEEIGGLGSKRFTELMPTLPNVNFIIQFDRRNNLDVTRYADDNDALIKEIVKLGYTEVSGSFSDISIICPKYSISGVNISASFFNEHTLTEYTDLRGLVNTFNQLDKFFRTDVISNKFTYKAKTYVTAGYEQTSLFDYDYSYKPTTVTPFKPLKTNSYVDDFSAHVCHECGLYADKLHPVADVGGDISICNKCASHVEDSYVCPMCDSFNGIDIATEVSFDLNKSLCYVTCVECMDAIPIKGLLPPKTVDHMISILMDSLKGMKK
jgi:hypothetical protein